MLRPDSDETRRGERCMSLATPGQRPSSYGDMQRLHITKAAGTSERDSVTMGVTILCRSLPLKKLLTGAQAIITPMKFLACDDGDDHDDLFAAFQGERGRV